MDWKPKPWGRVRDLFCDDRLYLTEIEAARGGYSSLHYHSECFNAFLILSGRLRVICYNTVGKRRSTILLPGSHPLVIAPMVLHRFEAMSEVVARELYWPTEQGRLDPGDIVRQDTGGLKELRHGG